jgi:hypothetical protein
MTIWSSSGTLSTKHGACRSHNLRVFFIVVAKPPVDVVPVDVLGFITVQRAGVTSARVLQSVEGPRS